MMMPRPTAPLLARFSLVSQLWWQMPVGSAAPVLDKDAAFAAQTFWDNRDLDWFKANIPFFECPDAEIVTNRAMIMNTRGSILSSASKRLLQIQLFILAHLPRAGVVAGFDASPLGAGSITAGDSKERGRFLAM